MIYLEIAGRLGNQMFRYAFARKLQKELQEKDLIINFHRVDREEGTGWEDSLTLFHTQYIADHEGKSVLKCKQMSIRQKMIYLFYRITSFLIRKVTKDEKKFQLRYQKWLSKNGLYWLELGYYPYQYTKNKSSFYYVYGCFECAKYFDDIRLELLEEFTPKKPEGNKNKALYEKIRNTESVCMSIRRGDFVSDPKFQKKYQVCTPEYYYEAVKKMKEKLPNMNLFIFSDEIEWAKENLNFGDIPVFYEDGTDSVDEKLRLMYSCKHFILSNSTFSWWAQYLSRNENKVVISPSRWYADGKQSDLIEENWLKIEV